MQSCIEIASVFIGPSVQRGTEHLFHCPRHHDKHPSLQINTSKNVWLCGPCGASGNAWQLAAFLAGCDRADKAAVKAWLQNHGFFKSAGTANISRAPKTEIASYPYRDSSGVLLYEKLRYEPKSFAVRRPDGHGGWLWDLKGTAPVLYNLPEVVKAGEVIYVEGEKDVETARKLGLVATTSGSVTSWRKQFAEIFRNRKVSIIADADEPGRKHASQVAADLLGVAAEVSILEVPASKDLSDWVDKGGTTEKLQELIAATPERAIVPTSPIAPPAPQGDRQAGSQVDRLIAAATREDVELFHNADGEPFATVPVGDHAETWPVGSQGFRQWLIYQYFIDEHKAPNPQSLQTSVHTDPSCVGMEGTERSSVQRPQ